MNYSLSARSFPWMTGKSISCRLGVEAFEPSRGNGLLSAQQREGCQLALAYHDNAGRSGAGHPWMVARNEVIASRASSSRPARKCPPMENVTSLEPLMSSCVWRACRKGTSPSSSQ